MPSRKPPQQPAQATLTGDQMRKGIARLGRVIDEIKAFDHNALTKRWGPEQKALEATIEGALASVFGHDTVEYRRYLRASTLDHGPVIMSYGGHRDDSHEARKYVAEGKAEATQILTSAIKWLHDEIGDSVESGAANSPTGPIAASSRKIFVVHGHDEGARETVARFLEKIGFEPIILHEQASQNRTVIEKIEAYDDVGFAVVLLTPDDEGRVMDGGPLEPRARQNVLLELGYFMGRLGREKVCALKRGEVAIPSDFAGVVWVAIDASNGWKLALGKELQAAGHTIDWNRVMA